MYAFTEIHLAPGQLRPGASRQCELGELGELSSMNSIKQLPILSHSHSSTLHPSLSQLACHLQLNSNIIILRLHFESTFNCLNIESIAWYAASSWSLHAPPTTPTPTPTPPPPPLKMPTTIPSTMINPTMPPHTLALAARAHPSTPRTPRLPLTLLEIRCSWKPMLARPCLMYVYPFVYICLRDHPLTPSRASTTAPNPSVPFARTFSLV